MEQHIEEKRIIRKRDFFAKLNSLESDHWEMFLLVKKVLREHRYALLFLYVERKSSWEYLIENHRHEFNNQQLVWVMNHLPKSMQSTSEGFIKDHKKILRVILEIEKTKTGCSIASLQFLKDLITPQIPITSMKIIFEHMLDAGLQSRVQDLNIN
jgi:hypothetical protein